MLPEMSTTRTMSMPSVRILVSLRPICGRASAAMKSRSVAPRKNSRIAGPSVDQNEDNERAVATEEYFSPPCCDRRRSHQSQSGMTSSKSRNHGLANFMWLPLSPARRVACRGQIFRQLRARAVCRIDLADGARILRGQILEGMHRAGLCGPGPVYGPGPLRREIPRWCAREHEDGIGLRDNDGRCRKDGCRILLPVDSVHVNVAIRESPVRTPWAAARLVFEKLDFGGATTSNPTQRPPRE